MFFLRKFYIFIIIFYCCNFAKQDTEAFGSIISKENGLDIKMLTSTVIRQKRSILDTLLSSIFYDDSDEDSDAAAENTDNEKYLICRNCEVIVHKDDSKMPTPPNNGMNPVNNTNTAPTANSTTMS